MFTLELFFLNEEGTKVKVSVDDPRSDLTQVEIEEAMDTIIAANVFTSKGGSFITKDSARIVERNVTEYEIA
ncbi:DUF2922 domain-containing protein [Sutcliffiella horikoshii]|uniref:DUF2922 domain-containing protein n=1 Tax=Sutcliffiella horikoshii TaxID=79883 RepID=A0A1Y0CR16_9BACI|nr:DUF2922 domain-containing protein [Sutcliffiella horikoshii]ART77245.1 hypothetical protein B4U37_14845 [Sutcliffiella horikoshii]TYS59305.1 DUF2922 domain-containing protein [Sutcliffiella horikoshii]